MSIPWPNRALLDLLGIELPIIQAPMAGANGSAMAAAVCEAGGLGSLPCAMLDAAVARAEIGVIRRALAAQCKREGFRLVEYSIQSNHIHLLVEADDKGIMSSSLAASSRASPSSSTSNGDGKARSSANATSPVLSAPRAR